MRANELWQALFRFTTGVYWLFYASQKWTGVGWMRPLMQHAPAANPIPGVHEILRDVVAPNWQLFAVLQGFGETVVAVLLILGLATRQAAILGLLLATGLALSVGFLAEPGFRWLYYLAVLVNAEVIVAGAGMPALERAGFVPNWLRS